MAKQLKPAGRSGVSGKKWVRPEDPSPLEASVEAPLESQAKVQVESPDQPSVQSQVASLVEADPEPNSGPESEACEVED